MLNPLPENKKVLFLSSHLNDKAATWLQATFKTLDKVTWNQFYDALALKFCDHHYENVVVRLNQSQQRGYVVDYHSQVEEFKALQYLVLKNEFYFIYSFVGRLKEIKGIVRMLNPHP